MACPGHVLSRVPHLQRVCPVASGAGSPPSSVEPQAQEGRLPRTPAASRQKGQRERGGPPPGPRGPHLPDPTPRPLLLPVGDGVGGVGAPPRPRPQFPGSDTDQRSPSPPGNHTTKVSARCSQHRRVRSLGSSLGAQSMLLSGFE